jgi:apolipoprotein N-acyltransferase
MVTTTQAILQTLAFLLFVGLGYAVALRIPRPRNPLLWIALAALALVSGWIGISLRVMYAFGTAFYLNTMLQGAGVGLLLGLVLRRNEPPA